MKWLLSFQILLPDSLIRAKNRFVKSGTANFGRNIPTEICGPPPEVIPNIPVRRNRNGPFHLNSNRNFRNLWHNGKHPTSHVSQNASLPSILSKSPRHVIRSFRRWMRSWKIHVKVQCFGKWCFYIRTPSIRSMFSSSLSLVYLFLSLSVCLGMLVFLEPFLNGGLLFLCQEDIMILVTSSFPKTSAFFPSTLKRNVGVFKLRRCEELFEKFRFRDGLVWTVGVFKYFWHGVEEP